MGMVKSTCLTYAIGFNRWDFIAMLKSVWVLLFFAALSSPVWAAPQCDKMAQVAEHDEDSFAPARAYKVGGSGRLYFHSAPNSVCRSKNVFVIPGDTLFAYSSYEGWVRVMYVNRNTADTVQGWVESARLKYAGTIGPAQ